MSYKKPKILIYDIETSPNIGYTWGTWEQNVIELIQQRQMISVAWKWLGEKEVYVKALCDFPGYKKNKNDNTALVKFFHKIICEADISIAHNGISFDDKRVNTDFIRCGLEPPPPRKSIDTLRVARAHFDFNSNRLNDLGQFLGVGKKVRHSGFSLWKGCLEGDPKSWDLMKRYNKGDITLLEKVYLKLRPWMPRHPNLSHYTGLWGCPVCQSKDFKPKGWRYLATGRKQRYKCDKCSHKFVGRIIHKG